MKILLGGLAAAALFLLGTTAIAGSVSEPKVQELSDAVAFAEGYWDENKNVLAQNIPARFHNPGDLGPGDAPGYPSASEGGSNVVQFPDDVTGRVYLETKIRRILSGGSSTYPLSFSFLQMAQSYAGNWQNWAGNVSYYLGVPQSMTLREWLAQ